MNKNLRQNPHDSLDPHLSHKKDPASSLIYVGWIVLPSVFRDFWKSQFLEILHHLFNQPGFHEFHVMGFFFLVACLNYLNQKASILLAKGNHLGPTRETVSRFEQMASSSITSQFQGFTSWGKR